MNSIARHSTFFGAPGAKALLVQILFSVLVAGAVFAADKKPLTNADVIKMTKAELPDSTILLSIQNSPTEFDTGPDALIELKSAGVSAKVIEAMLAAPARQSTNNAPTVPVAPPTAGQDPLPTAYGFYALADGKLVALSRSPVELVFGLFVGGGNSGRGMAVDGFKERPNLQSFNDPKVQFIIYEHQVNPSALKLAQLTLVKTMQAGDFNIINTQLEFFEGLYGVPPNKTVTVNLLRATHAVSFGVEPVPGRTEMYRLVPQQPLQRGMNYAFYTSEALHPGDVVFTASPDRKQTYGAFFKVDTRNATEAAATERSLTQLMNELIARPLKTPDQPDKAFSDEKAGVKIAYPADYEVRKSKRPVVAFLFAPGKGESEQSRPKISVTCEPTPLLTKNLSLEAAVKGTIDGIRSAFSDATITGPFKTTLAGVEAQLFVATGVEQGVLRQKAVTVAVCRKHVLGVVLHTTPETFPVYWDSYKRVCNSYELR